MYRLMEGDRYRCSSTTPTRWSARDGRCGSRWRWSSWEGDIVRVCVGVGVGIGGVLGGWWTFRHDNLFVRLVLVLIFVRFILVSLGFDTWQSRYLISWTQGAGIGSGRSLRLSL